MVGERLLMRVWDLYVQVTGIRFLSLSFSGHMSCAQAPQYVNAHM